MGYGGTWLHPCLNIAWLGQCRWWVSPHLLLHITCRLTEMLIIPIEVEQSTSGFLHYNIGVYCLLQYPALGPHMRLVRER